MHRFILLFMLCSTQVFAQSASPSAFTFYPVALDEGLPHYAAHHIMQDSFGFVWISTRDGLCRYNGTSCTVFKKNEDNGIQLKSDIIWLTFEDSKQRLWIGTKGGGLSFYNPFNNKTIVFEQDLSDEKSISNNIITAIFEDSQKNLWVGTDGGGLNRVFEAADSTFHFEKIQFSGEVGEVENLSILDIQEGEDGRLWLASYGHGVIIYNPDTRETDVINTNSEEHPLLDDYIMALAKEDSSMWIGSKFSGLAKLNTSDGSLVHFNSSKRGSSSLPDNFVWDIYVDKKQNKWISTYGGGLVQLKKGSEEFTRIVDVKTEEGFNDEYVLNVMEGQQGQFWIATDNQGVFYGREKQIFKAINVEWKNGENFSNLIINDLFQDSSGRFWISTNDGLFTADSSLQIAEPVEENFGTSIFYDVHEDENGTIWIASNFRLHYLDPENQRFSHLDLEKHFNKAGTDRIFDIETDPNGGIWLATDGGLVFYHHQRRELQLFEHKQQDENTISGNKLDDILLDGNNIWVATDDKGLSIFNSATKTAKRVNLGRFLDSSQISNYTTTLAKDEDDNIWVGTTDLGVYKIYKQGTEIDSLHHYSTKNRLTTNHIFDISFQDSLVLIFNREGLVVFNNHTNESKNIRYPSGFHQSAQKRLFKSPDGNYFYCRAEIYQLETSNLTDDSVPEPDISLIQLKVFNNKILPDPAVHLQEELNLTHDQDFVTIAYTTLNHDKSKRFITEYMLEGHDPFWLRGTESETINYTNLEPGNYTFKARIAGSTDSEKAITLPIIIQYPFWETYWFRAIILFIISGILYAAYKYRTYYLLREEETRNRIARDLHDDLSGTLSSISFFSEAAKRTQNTADGSGHYLQLIDKSAVEAKEKINDIIWAINPVNDDWSVFLKKCKRYAADTFDSKGIRYEIYIDEQVTFPMHLELRQNLWLIFKEIVNNIAKHSEAENALVNIKQEGKEIFLTIEDDGIGFNPEAETERNGIKNIVHRAKQIRAYTSLDTKPGLGTIWKMKLKPKTA